MPASIRWALKNYGVAICFMCIFTIVVWVHGLVMQAAIRYYAHALDRATAAIDAQTSVNGKLVEIFGITATAVKAGKQRTEENNKTLQENNRMLQELLKMAR